MEEWETIRRLFGFEMVEFGAPVSAPVYIVKSSVTLNKRAIQGGGSFN